MTHPSQRTTDRNAHGRQKCFAGRAPLGRTLELACGGGLLAELYLPHVSSAVLVDSSPLSLEIASRRLQSRPDVRLTRADVFTWDGDGDTFDTIIFSAWLHHVPHSRFDEFWRSIDRMLSGGGVVIFDFPDVRLGSGGKTHIPAEPSEEYVFYAPRDGVSVRDHGRRRWRVVHHLWEPHDLRSRLGALGWSMATLGPGLFDNVVWAEARR